MANKNQEIQARYEFALKKLHGMQEAVMHDFDNQKYDDAAEGVQEFFKGFHNLKAFSIRLQYEGYELDKYQSDYKSIEKMNERILTKLNELRKTTSRQIKSTQHLTNYNS